MATKFISKKTAIVAIVAAGAVSAILAVAFLAPAAASPFGPRFGMHGGFGPGGHFGGGHGGMWQQGQWASDANWTGSVPLESIQADVIESIKGKVNASVGDAEAAAMESIGDGSEVFSVTAAPVNGYLVYMVHGIDSSNNLHMVIVDAGNGQVLDSSEIDASQMMGGPWKAHSGMQQ